MITPGFYSKIHFNSYINVLNRWRECFIKAFLGFTDIAQQF